MKSKILDYIIIFILAFLVINFFQGGQEKKSVQKNTGIIINTKGSSFVVPASIKLNIENYTQKTIKLNTCKNISISRAGEVLKINDKTFCKDLTIKPNKKQTIDYQKYYKLFDKKSDYIFKVNIDGKEPLITSFSVDIRGFFGKFFTFFVYAPIYNLVVFFLKITGNSLFWSIILITIFVRILLIWPQHKMLVSQKKMQKIQPKIKALQEKYKGNHQILGQEMIKLYKEENVNPMGSCGLMLIQMPILLVLYNILLYIKDESNLFYLYSFLHPFDVSQINPHFYGMDLYGKGGTYGLILAIVVGVLQFLQVKYSMSQQKDNNNSKEIQKKKDDNSLASMMPDQKVMQNFMLYFLPVMIGIFTYSFPAGLGIYWGMTTLFMLIQQLIVNKILAKSS